MQTRTSYDKGRQAEALALRYLKKQGLKLMAQNYMPPGRGMADLDLVMRAKDDTLVFVEVKLRQTRDYGGGGASVGFAKQRRLMLSARYYLQQLRVAPACRFDVLLLEGVEFETSEPI